MATKELMDEIRVELERAQELFAPMANLHEGYAVLLEEVDEFWEHVKVNQKKRDYAVIRKELIQVAAMSARCIVDCIDRLGGSAPAGKEE